MDLRRNCLVIDDDKIALKLAASCCHELGLKVYIADTPTEAVDELKRRRYELIVVGQISAQVFALLSAHLAVIVLLMTAISQYVALFNQRL